MRYSRLEGKTVAVTGATGFFGFYLVKVLLSRGARVRAVVRNPGRFPPLAAMSGVTFARADLLDRGALARGFEGVDAVIGNAAISSPTNNDWNENYRVNKVGVDNVVGAMAAAGVRRFVHISTIGVYDLPFGALRLEEPIPEDHPLLEPWHRHIVGSFRVSKALGEKAARDGSARANLDLTVVRTSATYGFRDPHWIPLFRRLIRMPVAPALRLKFSLVYALDAAEAVVESLACGRAIGRSYNVAGPPDKTLYDFLGAWKQVTGRKCRLIPIPVPIWLAFDSTQARKDLSFCNRAPEDAFRHTLEWETRHAAA